MVISEPEHIYFFQEDGSLNWNGTSFNYTRYCVATVEGAAAGSYHRQAHVCTNTGDSLEALLQTSRSVMPALYGASLVFLTLALALVYSRQKNLYGAMTMAMLSMLFCFYAVLLVPLAAGSGHVSSQPVLCQIEGFSIQVK